MFNVSKLPIKIRQKMNSQETSFPYLSGDTFKLTTQLSFESTDDFKASHLWRDVKVVFCKSELIELFVSEKPRSLNPLVLVCGNSDHEFYDFENSGMTKLKAAFLQNSFISDNKRIFTLPIGLENSKYASNGRVSLYSKSLVALKQNSVLVGPFGNTHDERRKLSSLKSSESVHCISDRVSIKRHLKNLDAYKYVACPRGNGVDTHRVWETFYRGSIPVLTTNLWSESLYKFGFPIKLIESWDEVTEVTSSTDTLSPIQICSYPYLWMSEWEKFISSFL